MTDPRNVWALDTRPIRSALMESNDPAEVACPMEAQDGWVFERFERNGEMAMIPYLRVTRGTVCFEAPLTHWAWINVEEAADAR